MASGSPSVLSTSMPDNSWIDYEIATGDSARSPSGNYFYRLRIQLLAGARAEHAQHLAGHQVGPAERRDRWIGFDRCFHRLHQQQLCLRALGQVGRQRQRLRRQW